MDLLSNEVLLQHLTQKFGEALFNIEEPHGLLTVTTTRNHLLPLLEYLYHDAYLQMNFLTTMCGIHYPGQKETELGMI